MHVAVKVALVAVPVLLGGLWNILKEDPVFSNRPETEEYNLADVEAPALAGAALRVASWFVTETPLGFLFMKQMLRKNGFRAVRQLAAQHPLEVPTYYPMERLCAAKYGEHVKLAQDSGSDEMVLSGLKQLIKSPYKSIVDYHDFYKSGKALPSQVIEETLTASMQFNKTLRIFAAILPEKVRAQALASDARWKAGKPLSVFDGVPVAVKDMIDVKDHPIYDGGSQPVTSTEDDIIVARLREAGAIILGTTVMTEGGVSPLGYNAHFHGPLNAYNQAHHPGGSSSGSAVAVATGLVPMAIAFDGGGSVRLPASMSGLFGLATTFGRVPFGYDGLASTMIKAGPIGATALDCALTHVLIGKPEPGHMYSELYDGGVNGPPPPHAATFMKVESLKGVRLGIFWDHFNDADMEVRAAALRAVDSLEAQGATIVNVSIPHLKEFSLSHSSKILTEFALGWDAKYHDSQVEIEPSTCMTLALGKALSAQEVLASERVRTLAIRYLRTMFREKNLDAYVTPTLGIKVPLIHPNSFDTGESNNPTVYQTMKYIFLANLAGRPGLTVPISYENETGLPIGLHLMGDSWTEHKLLRIGNALEHHHMAGDRRTPPKPYFHQPFQNFGV
mmetsp:Transcript_15651/g.28689  ORF Transcript_15651/g.28689 Transcript_15651/m.28689 type:complete len:618 (+) Transcript_15651:62-1915(+)